MASSITTRTGDDGTTGLLYGQRVPKHHPQIEAVGVCDELNTALGLAKASHADAGVRAQLAAIQHELVALMGELACAETDVGRWEKSKFAKIDESSLARIDADAAALETLGLRFDGWATPGATVSSATLDVARTTARRAERTLSALPERGRSVRPVLLRYINRVSDFLWLLARAAEQSSLPPPAATASDGL